MSDSLTLTHDRLEVRSRTAHKVAHHPDSANTVSTVIRPRRNCIFSLKEPTRRQRDKRTRISMSPASLAARNRSAHWKKASSFCRECHPEEAPAFAKRRAADEESMYSSPCRVAHVWRFRDVVNPAAIPQTRNGLTGLPTGRCPAPCDGSKGWATRST
jgi:hypothetical protein